MLKMLQNFVESFSSAQLEGFDQMRGSVCNCNHQDEDGCELGCRGQEMSHYFSVSSLRYPLCSLHRHHSLLQRGNFDDYDPKKDVCNFWCLSVSKSN